MLLRLFEKLQTTWYERFEFEGTGLCELAKSVDGRRSLVELAGIHVKIAIAIGVCADIDFAVCALDLFYASLALCTVEGKANDLVEEGVELGLQGVGEIVKEGEAGLLDE